MCYTRQGHRYKKLFQAAPIEDTSVNPIKPLGYAQTLRLPLIRRHSGNNFHQRKVNMIVMLFMHNHVTVISLLLLVTTFRARCVNKVSTLRRDVEIPGTGDDILDNLSTNIEEDRPTRALIDPKGSWMQFVRHSEKMNMRRQPKKCKRRNKKAMLHGPPGPQGPPGPPGRPGAEMTKEDMMKEFHSLVKEMSEKRAEELLSERCEACTSLLNGSYSLSPDVDQMLLVPRVTAAFHMQLQKSITVAQETFMELKHFQQPFGIGAFHRGHVFSSRDGRFVAPRDGLYQFTAHIHIKPKYKVKVKDTDRRLRKRDYIKIQLCIESLCHKNTSLEFISGLETNSRVFTVSVSGLLELKLGQYVSVHVDNASRIPVKVQSGSDFTGILFGV